MHKLISLIAFLLAATAAYSAQTLAVLEIVPVSEIDDISLVEYRHLTDELRRQAVQTMPEGYSVLTRDNMISLLPQDDEERECLAESCAVEIGRAIGAEYISQGSIGRFAGELSLSIELYETLSGKLLGSIVMEGKDVKGLLMVIREQASSLFAKISKKSAEPATQVAMPAKAAQTIPNNEKIKVESPETAKYNDPVNVNVNVAVNTEQKSKTSSLVAVTFDVLGALGLGFGIYKHIDATIKYDDYKKMAEKRKVSVDEFEKQYKEVKDAKDLRNIALIAGGALLLTGITIHVFF